MSGMANVQVPSTPSYADFPVYNYSTTVTLLVGETVAVDATNVVGGSNLGVGVIKVAANGNDCDGIVMENIPPLSAGRIRCGGLAASIADGAITAGTFVDGSATAARGVVAHGAGKASIGKAWTTAADGEQIMVLVSISKGA